MRRQSYVLSVLLLGLALLAPRIAFAQEETLIVPGASVGSIKIGDSKQQVVSMLGKPELEGTDDTPNEINLQYFKKKIYFLIRSDKVHHIFVLNPSYRTREGVGVGSSQGDVESAMGSPVDRKEGKTGPELTYANGIRFIFMNGQVLGMEVRPSQK